ncbi:MAG: arginine--tRNA ligase, partial [Clostridia bacterium]|nr:arginine--tRNA ligase [Clostridia bacterium]
MLTPKEQIISLILPHLSSDGITREELATLIDYPKSADLGDYTLACFVLAKKLRKAPPIIAKELLEVIEAAGSELFTSVEAVGGYLNFRLSDASKTAALASFALAGDDYGKSDEGAGKTIVLDFSSPNIAKPFHIGHLGTTAIGNSLRRMHEFCGYKTVSINHLGDWGTQFGRLIVAYRRWGSEREIEEGGVDALGEIYRRFYAEAEEDPTLNDEARAAFAAMEAGDPEALRLWQWFKDISLAEFQKTYKLLNIDFDSWNGEAFYNDKMDAVIAELE